jgi:hypothetical protein
LLLLRVKMERALAEEAKAASAKDEKTALEKREKTVLEKQLTAEAATVAALRAECAAKDVRISQMLEQMRSGARQMEEQVRCSCRLSEFRVV